MGRGEVHEEEVGAAEEDAEGSRFARIIEKSHLRCVFSQLTPFPYKRPVPQPIVSKQTRTGFHQTIRELFNGRLDTETDISESTDLGDGSRIVIRWARKGSGSGRGGKIPCCHLE